MAILLFAHKNPATILILYIDTTINKANYERLAVRCKKGRKEVYEKLAADRGVSLNHLIIDLLEKEAENME